MPGRGDACSSQQRFLRPGAPALALLLVGLGLACARPQPPALVLLLSVDTLRADRLGCYGSPLGLTPTLDALASRSLLFEHAFAPASFTLASMSALLTGRYPEELGVLGNHATLPDDVPTLASVLSARGYRSGAVVGNWVLRRDAGLARGFELYDDRFPDAEAVRHLPERVAAATTDAALATLDRLREPSEAPIFLWVHYQDPHGPYTPPPGYRERFLELERGAPDGERLLEPGADVSGLGWIPSYQVLGDERQVAFYRAGYDGEVRYLDEQIARLLRGLDERGLAERTALVFTSDHGEGMGEDDYWFAHGEYLSVPLVHVPLLIALPDGPAGRRRDVASLLDLFPTLLGLGAPAPTPASRGRDLLAASADATPSQVYLASLGASRVPRFGLVADGLLYRVHLEGLTPSEQTTPLAGPGGAAVGPDRLEALRASLAAIRKEVQAGAREMRRQDLAPEDHDRLRALGYVADP